MQFGGKGNRVSSVSPEMCWIFHHLRERKSIIPWIGRLITIVSTIAVNNAFSLATTIPLLLQHAYQTISIYIDYF